MLRIGRGRQRNATQNGSRGRPPSLKLGDGEEWTVRGLRRHARCISPEPPCSAAVVFAVAANDLSGGPAATLRAGLQDQAPQGDLTLRDRRNRRLPSEEPAQLIECHRLQSPQRQANRIRDRAGGQLDSEGVQSQGEGGYLTLPAGSQKSEHDR